MVPELVVGEAEMARLADLDAGEALDAEGEVIVGVGPIDDPPPFALRAAGGEAEAAVKLRKVGVFEADEVELAFAGEDGAGAFLLLEEAAEALGGGGEGEQEEGGQQAAAHGDMVTEGAADWQAIPPARSYRAAIFSTARATARSAPGESPSRSAKLSPPMPRIQARGALP